MAVLKGSSGPSRIGVAIATTTAHTLLGDIGLRRAYGPDELTLLATAPSLHDYRIIVVDANGAYACFAYGLCHTLLGLLHEDGPAFFSKSYLCA